MSIHWIYASGEECKIVRPNGDSAVCAGSAIHLADRTNTTADKKAQDRAAEAQSSSSDTSSTKPDSQTRSRQGTLESQPTTDTRRDSSAGLDPPIHVDTSHPTIIRQPSLSDPIPNHPEDSAAVSFHRSVLNTNHVLHGCSIDCEHLVTGVRQLNFYAASPLTFSQSQPSPHGLHSALSDLLETGDDFSYDQVSPQLLHNEPIFDFTDDFKTDYLPAQPFLNSYGTVIDSFPPLSSTLLPPSHRTVSSPVHKQANITRSAPTSRHDSFYEMPPTRPVSTSKPPLQDPTLPKNDNNIDDENDGKPLLHVSVETGHEGVVRILIDSGVNVNERDRYEGNTALHIAVWQKNEAVLRLLVESGADVNATDNLGRTPLHQAVATGFEAGLRLLLAHGADINIREKKHTKKRSLG
jgi:hypothetical protein